MPLNSNLRSHRARCGRIPADGIFRENIQSKKKKRGKPCRTETWREKGRNDVGAHRRSVFRDSVNTFRFTQTRFYSVIEVDSSPACISIGILEEQQFRNIRAARFFWMETVRTKVARFSYADCKAATFVINTFSPTLHVALTFIDSLFFFSFFTPNSRRFFHLFNGFSSFLAFSLSFLFYWHGEKKKW